MEKLSLDVIVTRGSTTESIHRVHAAVVNADGTLLAGARDTDLVTMWRSCAKFFQVLPFLTSGGFDQVGWGEEELALSCASHGGEPEHVAVALRPPKSAAAVPDISECTPVTAATMSNAATPTTMGRENRFIAITAAIMSMKAQNKAAGGPRRA